MIDVDNLIPVVITTVGNIPNQYPGVKANPRECENYSTTVEYTLDPEVEDKLIHNEWYTEGEFPKGLTIDPDTGVISGNMKMFILQELNSSLYAPNEPLKMDGSNRLNNGNFTGTTYTFNFTICKRTTLEYTTLDIDPDAVDVEDLTKEYINTSDVNIVMIKSGNIENTLFIKNYLDNDEIDPINSLFMINDFIQTEIIFERRHMMVGDRKYYKEDLEDLYRDHPGPFSKCEG